ncbi:hypothetical protein ACHAXS_009397 [Conticribra weissflogii]
MARSQPNVNKWLEIGERAIQSHKTWVKHSEWNFENKLLLLEAELLYLKGKYVSAEKKYISSIESAHRHKFVHEEGLAMDRISSYYKFRGNVGKETEYLNGAFSCYETWGALGLLKHLVEK